MASTLKKKKPNKSWSNYLVYAVVLGLIFLVFFYVTRESKDLQEPSYDQMLVVLNTEDIKEVTLSPVAGDYNQNMTFIRAISKDGKTIWESYIIG